MSVEHTYQLYGVEKDTIDKLNYPLFKMTTEECNFLFRMLNRLYYEKMHWRDTTLELSYLKVDPEYKQGYIWDPLCRKLKNSLRIPNLACFKAGASSIEEYLGYTICRRLDYLGLSWYDCRIIWFEKLLRENE